MTSAPRSPYQILITLLLFLAALAWGLVQLHQRPVNGEGLNSDWLNVRTWLMPLANHPSLGQVGINVGQLNDVMFIDAQHGWAVGDKGIILATDNGGQHWQKQNSGVKTVLYSVHLSDSQHGWVVGENGIVLATDNGGQSWHKQNSGVTTWLNSVQFSDSQHGWVVDGNGIILATDNGGQRWQAQNSGVITGLESVHFSDSQHGWVVGENGIILVTNNGGQSWHKQNSGVTTWLQSVHFSDSQHGWAVGFDGIILATDNGGQSWHKQNSGVTTILLSVYFSDSQHGWAVGFDGIIATDNGGKTWQTQNSGVTTGRLNSVHFSDSQHGWAVGSGGIIFATDNGGQSWYKQNNGVTRLLSSVHFSDSQHGWAVGEYSIILATDNGGKTWQAQNSGVRSWRISVHFSDDQHGWAVGSGGIIFATDNGGQRWQKQNSGVTTILLSVYFSDSQHGWAVGADGIILATDNGGQSWQKQNSGVTRLLFSVHFSDSQHGWAVGFDGIIATDNGGKTWQTQNSGVTTGLHSVHFSDSQHGWAVGYDDIILATDNGGQSWHKQNSGATTEFESVHFSDSQHGWVVGAGGTILATDNGGQCWQTQNSGVTTWLNSVHFSDSQHGWVVGYDGIILATDNGGQSWQNQSPPSTVFAEGRPKLAVLPSPIALLLLLVTGGLLMWKLYRYFAEPRSLQGGISDAPIDRADADVLGRGELVKTLANLIRNRDTVPPLAIAIAAAWGSGKSSVLALLQAELQGEVFPVTLNAWHYKDDSTLLAALMAHIREALPPLLSVDNALFRLRLLWIRCFSGAGWRYGFGLSLAIVAGVYFASLKNWHNLNDWLQRESATLLPSWLEPLKQQAWLQLLFLLVSAVLTYRLLKSWLAALSAFSPELVALLTQLGKPAREAMQVADWSKDAGLRFRFAQDFNDITNALGKGRLLLLIDDLDRCEAKQIESVMATLNFLFSSPAPCYAVLAMDWDYVTKALGFAFKDLVIINAGETDSVIEEKRCAFASRYLEKIIQIRINLPSVDSSAVALHDRSQTNTNTVKNWWGCLKNRWTWLQSAPRYRFRLPWLVAFALLWCLTLLWRGVEAVLWLSWQAVKSFNSKMLTPIYDIVLIVLLATGLMWSAVELGAWAQDKLPLEIKIETSVATATPANPDPAKPDSKPAPEKIDSKNTAVPVVVVDEPLYPTDYGLEGLAGVFALFLALMVWRLSLRLQDTRVFIEVMTEWRDFLAKHHATPRDWKRLLNRARLFAMRVRVSVEKPWYAAFDERWTRGRFVTTPAATDETVLDERLAMHLMMLDVFAKGKIVKDLPLLLLQRDDGVWQRGEESNLDDGVFSWLYFPVLKDFFENLYPSKKDTPEGIQARAQFKTWLTLYEGLNG